jgi:uncharacterized protein (TIGR03083 family)
MVHIPASDPAAWLAELRREGAAFRAAVSVDVLDRPVPSCPDWTVARLVGHLGSVHRWVWSIVESKATTAPDGPRPAPPEETDALLPWFDEGLTGVADALAATPPATPMWNWSVLPREAVFWYRRMAEETAVHRWDAQTAVALPEPIAPQLAVDGITEVIEAFLPTGRRAGPSNQRGVVRLVATDTVGTWTVRIRGEAIALLDTDTVLDHGTLEVTGNPALVESLRAK